MYKPKTRLEKILHGQSMKARSGLEEAVQTALANAGGGVQPMIVTMTPVEGGDDDYPMFTADKTIAEIAAAYNALTPVYFRGGLEGVDHLPLTFAMYNSGEESAFGVALAGFVGAQIDSGEGLGAVSFSGRTGEEGDVWMLVNWNSDESYGPIELEATIIPEESITLKETAKELSELCEKGRLFRLSGSVSSDGGSMYITYSDINIRCMEVDGTGHTTYAFAAELETTYLSAQLGEYDTVVLTKVTGE